MNIFLPVCTRVCRVLALTPINPLKTQDVVKLMSDVALICKVISKTSKQTLILRHFHFLPKFLHDFIFHKRMKTFDLDA